jgi:hypothetical protein
MGSQELGGKTVDAASLSGHFEELVDELNVTPNIGAAHPPNLSLPHHVHRLITMNGSLRRLEFSEPLLNRGTRRNRWPDTDSTNIPSLERRSRPRAKICWSA